jgi:hypothetical protein
MAQAVTFLISIWKVPGSNLGRNKYYSEFFVILPRSPWKMLRENY